MQWLREKMRGREFTLPNFLGKFFLLFEWLQRDAYMIKDVPNPCVTGKWDQNCKSSVWCSCWIRWLLLLGFLRLRRPLRLFSFVTMFCCNMSVMSSRIIKTLITPTTLIGKDSETALFVFNGRIIQVWGLDSLDSYVAQKGHYLLVVARQTKPADERRCSYLGICVAAERAPKHPKEQ